MTGPRTRLKNDGVEYSLPKEIFVKPEDDGDGPWLNAAEDVNDFAAVGGEVMVGRYVLAAVEVISAPVTLRRTRTVNRGG